MTDLATLTTVVLDWDLAAYTLRSVRSLIGDGLDPRRIVVVLNGPTDTAWAAARDELGACILVRIERNVGFARANNIGARALPGDAYLFCNNDAFVHAPGSVAALLAAARREGVGIAVPRLLNEDGSLQSSVVPFAGPAVAAVRASGLSRLVPNRWQPHLSTHWDHATSREIESAVGAVMLVRGDVWDRLGGLRETSFMYAEDIDLSWRARNEGWKTWFAAEAEFVHIGGASSDRRWTARERSQRVARAEASMIRSHLSPAGAATTLLLMRLGHLTRGLLFGLLGRHDAAESARGFVGGLREAPLDHPDVVTDPAPEVEILFPPA